MVSLNKKRGCNNLFAKPIVLRFQVKNFLFSNFVKNSSVHPHIKKLIEEGEHQQLDFKFAVTDARKIARSLAAFANTDGGRLLIGVKDNGKVAGVRSEEEIYMLDAAANMYCDPPVYFETIEWNIEGKRILEAIIPKSDKGPHYAPQREDKSLIYVRVNDQNLLANSVIIKVWKRLKKGKGTSLQYTENEKVLLRHLQENQSITLPEFRKLADISKRKAETILVNLIVLDIIDIHITEQEAYYTLNQSSTSE